jgi:hypothetical protein
MNLQQLFDEKSEIEWAQIYWNHVILRKETQNLLRYRCILHRALTFYKDHVEKEIQNESSNRDKARQIQARDI